MLSSLTGNVAFVSLCWIMQAVQFYKAWDEYGALSNFSCHPIRLPEGPLTDATTAQNCSSTHDWREWRSVEHYYQAQKFASTSGKLRPVKPVHAQVQRLTAA